MKYRFETDEGKVATILLSWLLLDFKSLTSPLKKTSSKFLKGKSLFESLVNGHLGKFGLLVQDCSDDPIPHTKVLASFSLAEVNVIPATLLSEEAKNLLNSFYTENSLRVKT